MGAPVGNQNAASAKEWQQSLRRAMARKADGDFRITLDRIADRVVDSALDGDRESWQEIANRLDGKPAQSVDVGNKDDAAFRIEQIVRKIVDPRD